MSVIYNTGDYQERPWGKWVVIDIGDTYVIKKLQLKPGKNISLQYHEFRSEHWVCVNGTGVAIIGHNFMDIKKGTNISIPVKEFHYLKNTGDNNLVLVEIQLGSLLCETDIVRLSY